MFPNYQDYLNASKNTPENFVAPLEIFVRELGRAGDIIRYSRAVSDHDKAVVLAEEFDFRAKAELPPYNENNARLKAIQTEDVRLFLASYWKSFYQSREQAQVLDASYLRDAGYPGKVNA